MLNKKCTKNVLLATLTSSLAILSAPAAASYGQFYLGLQGGVDSLQFNRKTVTTIPTIAGPLTQTLDRRVGDTSGIFGAYFGYEFFVADSFFIALEIAGNKDVTSVDTDLSSFITTPIGTFTPTTVSFSEEIDTNYNIAIMPGFRFNKSSKLYGKLAAHRGDMKLTLNSATALDETFSGTRKKTISGASGGFGMAYDIVPEVGLRLEYNYVQYSSQSVTAFDAITGNTTKVTHKPSSNMVMLGIQYQFRI